MNLICKQCNREFETENESRKYCNQNCYTLARIGVARPDSFKEKVKATLTGVKHTEERKRNCSIGKQIVLTGEKETELRKLIEFGMTKQHILTKTGIDPAVYERHRKKWYPDGIFQLRYIESWVEPELIEEIMDFCRKGYRWKRIARILKISPKITKNIIKQMGKKFPDVKLISYDDDCWKNRVETVPEKMVREFLEKNGIKFKQEYQISPGHAFVYDFIILGTNSLIEVNGDYWHCNPKVYPHPINNYQKWAMRRDFAKRNYAVEKGYRSLTVWEYDLHNNQQEVYDRLTKEIETWKKQQ